VLVVLFFGYIVYQYKNYTGAPYLEIYYPQNNIVVVSDIIDITGKTQLDSDVYINNQKVVLNNDGSFATSLKLKEGINTLSINAINRLSKKTELIKTIIYRPEQKQREITPLEVTESTPSAAVESTASLGE
jgi:trehalose/maltose hydrolase-like predicted phosphorylase